MSSRRVEVSQQDGAPLIVALNLCSVIVVGVFGAVLEVLLLLDDGGNTEVLDDVFQKDLCPSVGAHHDVDGRVLRDGKLGGVAIDSSG